MLNTQTNSDSRIFRIIATDNRTNETATFICRTRERALQTLVALRKAYGASISFRVERK